MAQVALTSLTNRAIRTAILHVLEQDDGSDWLDKLMGPVLPSDQPEETYAGVGAVKGLSKKLGARSMSKPSAYKYIVKNEKYSGGIYVSLDEIRRDKTKQVSQRINQFGEDAQTHWATMGSDIIKNGEFEKCYDQKSFFATNHKIKNSGVQSNSITHAVATPATPTAGEMETAMLNAIKHMLKFTDDEGNLANRLAKEFLVMVPLDLMIPASAALGSQIIVDTPGAGGRSNILQTIGSIGGFKIELRVNPDLSVGDRAWTTKFSVFRTDTSSRPLIRQEEMGPTMFQQTEGSALEFEEETHAYAIDTIRGVGFNNWTRACLNELVASSG